MPSPSPKEFLKRQTGGLSPLMSGKFLRTISHSIISRRRLWKPFGDSSVRIDAARMIPEVTIVIPVYNRASLLRRCVDSALAQTWRNLEIVISDNASEDGSWDVVQDYVSRDSRVRGYRNPTNIGPVENWIRGVEQARGKYCKILFSDDYLEPEYLEQTVPMLNDESVGFVFSAVSVERRCRGPKTTAYWWKGASGKYPNPQFIRDGLLGGDVPVSPSAAVFRTVDVRRNLLNKLESPTFSDWGSHGGGVDQLLYLLTAVQYPFVAYLASPCMSFGNQADTITNSMAGYTASSRYLQARVWFAARFGYPKELKALLAQAWIIEIRYAKRVCSPATVYRKYMTVPPRVGCLSVASAAGKQTLIFTRRLAERWLRWSRRSRQSPSAC